MSHLPYFPNTDDEDTRPMRPVTPPPVKLVKIRDTRSQYTRTRLVVSGEVLNEHLRAGWVIVEDDGEDTRDA